MANTSLNHVWVYVDLRNQRHFKSCLNVLGAARQLSDQIAGKAVAVILSNDKNLIEDTNLPPLVSVDTASQDCISHGADLVYLLTHQAPPFPRADIHANLLSTVIEEKAPRVVLFALSDFCRDLAARSARICHSGLIADCVDLNIEDDSIIASCPSWGGEIMADLTFADNGSTGFITIQPHAFQSVDIHGIPGSIEKINLGKTSISTNLKLVSSSNVSSKYRKLEEAETIVIGGAGVGTAEGFKRVRELTAALGGEIGGTRPPVRHHWVDEERLIGQTGKSVRPNLLVSVGTSGAIQYTAGITESKTIVAINRDPHAPIFQVADIGIVADANSFVPAFTDRVKQGVMRRLADVLSEDPHPKASESFGQKVIKLRKSHGWSVEDLAEKTGRTPEHLQQVECDKIVPSVSFLLRLARALKVDPGTFLRNEEKSAIQDQRTQAFIKRTKNYYYQTLTPGAKNEHLRGFMITIAPHQVHKPVEYRHEGEEFIHVMEGRLELTLDNKAHILNPGESKHFNSEIPHKLKSLSTEATRCLVVLYTP